jgi:8-oxo-dGTP pyrophosphatase MutT (NUDIX family)
MLFRTDARTQRWELLCLALDRLSDAAPTECGGLAREVNLADLGADDYLVGLVDLLAALGAIEVLCEPLLVRVSSPNAGYMLRLLSDLIDTGAPLVRDWRRTEPTPRSKLLHPFGAASDLLRALELRRLELLPAAAPVREIKAVVGLIVRQAERGDRTYLLVWDAAAQTWQFPGGACERRDGEPSATLLRKLREELGLDTVVLLDDVSLTELGHPLTDVQLAPAGGLRTKAILHSYIVRLRREPLLTTDVRWVSEAEVLAGRTLEGQCVSSAQLMQLLAHYSDELGTLLLKSLRWCDIRLAL